MDFLSEREKSRIRSDLRALVSDRQLSGTVIYQSYVGRGTFNPSSGAITETYAGTWVDGYRRPMSDDEVSNSGGRYQVGDYTYYFATEDIIRPKKDDRVIDSGVIRYVVGFTTDSISIFHSVVVRNLG